MNQRLSIKVDGYELVGMTEQSRTRNVIVDAGRNLSDFMMISNPSLKIKVSITIYLLNASQFDELIAIMGGEDVTHTVAMYDEKTKLQKEYQMYHTDISQSPVLAGNEVWYKNIKFDLIER